MTRGTWHEEADLIVVGGSVGGLAAAVAAADRRGRVVVVERAKELGGRATTEAEVIAAAGTRYQRAAGIDDAPGRLAADVLAATRHHADPAVATALAEQSAGLVAWLVDRFGASVELVAHRADGHAVPRLHAPSERAGAGLVADLVRAVTRHSHVGVRTATLVERLVRDDAGAVRGVALRPDRRGSGQALAGRVLLACGGFAADDALVAEHCPEVAALPYGGVAAAGDALRLGHEAGAEARRLGACQVTPFLAMPANLAVSAPLVQLGAILVNQAGHRFADETGDARALALAVRAQPGRMAYLVFDDRIAEAARAADPFFARVVLPRTGRRAATLDHLAKQFELSADGLRLTVETFNGNRDLGGDPFGRDVFGGPLAEPFSAIRVTGARWRTLGGLAVDAAARVLGSNGTPIDGLYAAGGAAAGLGAEGTEEALRGVDTLAALGLGRLAALDVIAHTSPPSPDDA